MPRNTTVVAVCGSPAEESVTRVALCEVLTAATVAGAETAQDCSGDDESLADRVQRLGTELVRDADVAQCPEAANVTAPNLHAD
jgi:hypothetical protein